MAAAAPLGMPSGKVEHHPGWKPLQGSAATMSQAGLQARAGSPDPLRGTCKSPSGFSLSVSPRRESRETCGRERDPRAGAHARAIRITSTPFRAPPPVNVCGAGCAAFYHKRVCCFFDWVQSGSVAVLVCNYALRSTVSQRPRTLVSNYHTVSPHRHPAWPRETCLCTACARGRRKGGP